VSIALIINHISWGSFDDICRYCLLKHFRPKKLAIDHITKAYLSYHWGGCENLHSVPSIDLGFQPTTQIWIWINQQHGGNGMMMDPYPHLQHVKAVKPLAYNIGVDVGTILCGFGASTNAQGLHVASSSDPPGFQLTSQLWTDKCGSNDVMMDPYSHPQHMKVVTPLAYCICLEWSFDHSMSQPFHNGSMWHQAVTQDFSRLPKSGPASVVETA
jgi:hypothetical protein